MNMTSLRVLQCLMATLPSEKRGGMVWFGNASESRRRADNHNQIIRENYQRIKVVKYLS